MGRRNPIALLGALCLGLGAAPPAPAQAVEGSSPGTFAVGGLPCNLLAVPAAGPLGVATPCPGVRPGAMVQTTTGQCTFNFMWRGGGDAYMGTAGHCVIDGGEARWAAGSGPAAFDSDGRHVGEFAYAVVAAPLDFALVRLDPGVAASPQMCHFGGPTGVNADRPPVLEPVILNHFGHGALVGDLVPGRVLLALGMPSRDHVFALGAVAPGDSGSGVISADGRAVGVVVTLGLHLGGLGPGGLDAGLVGVARLGPPVSRASAALGIPLDLQTAPLL